MLLVAKERMVFDMENESAKQLWQNFKLQNPNVPDTYSVWAFGDSKEMADELSALVLNFILQLYSETSPIKVLASLLQELHRRHKIAKPVSVGNDLWGS